MQCHRCRQHKAIYNVVAPACHIAHTVSLCPACFQEGIDANEIRWIGSKPFGFCVDHPEVKSA